MIHKVSTIFLVDSSAARELPTHCGMSVGDRGGGYPPPHVLLLRGVLPLPELNFAGAAASGGGHPLLLRGGTYPPRQLLLRHGTLPRKIWLVLRLYVLPLK